MQCGKPVENFPEKLEYDILTKTTTTGPHRDEFIVYVNNKELEFMVLKDNNAQLVLH